MIEQSERLAAAALEAAPDIPVHVADAVAIPLEDGAADLAVASMSLLNMDDMAGAVGEVARVLAPGGRFAFNVPHPMVSATKAGSYFDEIRFEETRERGGVSMTFVDVHRPLGAYFDALERAGLLVEALREPHPFLVVRAVKP